MAESEEALQLKRRARRRLVGAIALVTFVVIILPLLLDKEPGPPGPPLDVQIPKPDSSAFNSRIGTPITPGPIAPATGGKSEVAAARADAPGSNAEQAVKPAEAKPSVQTAAKAEASAKPEPVAKSAEAARPAAPVEAAKSESSAAKPELPAKSEPAAKAAPKPAGAAEKPPLTAVKPADKSADKSEQEKAQAALRDEAWVIALDAFSDVKNVKQLRTRLSAAGVKSYTEPVKTSKGDLTRVRAGPFESKEAAEKVRAKLEGMGLKPGAVVSR